MQGNCGRDEDAERFPPAKRNADPDALGEGMRRHDPQDQERLACIRAI